MGLWFLISIFLSLIVPVALRFLLATANKKNRNLPPGPPTLLPFFGNLQWLKKSFFELKPILHQLHEKYGPIITIRIGTRILIFISDHSLACKALIKEGAVFSDRPPANETGRIFNSNQHNISSAGYGPLWRLLRRNLMSEILHPTRIKTYAQARKWVLQNLTNELMGHVHSGEPVCVMESFQHAMFRLLLFMCFGETLDDSLVKQIEKVERRLLGTAVGFSIFYCLPKIGKIMFRERWKELLAIRHEQEELLIPLIRARKDSKEKENKENENSLIVFSYVDSLLSLEVPDEGGVRKLTEGEMVSLVSEFLVAGTDTTSTLLQWVMAHVVKDKELQEKVVEEIGWVVENAAEEVKEEDLSQMPYLKAVVTEGLRWHPPGHFLLPHAVTEEVTLEGYVIPKEATILFMVGEMGRDAKAWEDPMAFRPERFMGLEGEGDGEWEGGERVDIRWSKMKMMPFGAGRRICPGMNVGMLHVEYFVANLVWEFEWRAVDGEEVDLSEKMEFTVVMKKPLKTKIIRRTR